MKIKKNNKTIETSIYIKVADRFSTRLRGFMFRKQKLHNEGLLITPCNSIHMFFMYITIDVVFIDNENKVVKVKESLKPWKFVLPVKHAKAAVELPVGTIKEYNLKVGDKLVF
ncbi:DUF192 domain-containing protein [Evansella sp. AB-P1]|uniref:DUF192 domain-containing protein n=1 Tax=Evansella sp. AB-P1 TaxID=3037653 RepID=UPI00241EEBD4|nr:DUF192 domain-containing protein [Evansella sp. AB-P1]MDG5788476.1 DUF192 domain-containing protein [Evansella sp. AB-P1]